MNMDTIKVISVDDSPIFAERLKNTFGEMKNINYLGNANNVTSAISLIDTHKPNVVILDINLDKNHQNANGIFLLIVFRKKYPEMKIIMLTNLSFPIYRSTCIKNGADFFIDKTLEFNRVEETIRSIQHLDSMHLIAS